VKRFCKTPLKEPGIFKKSQKIVISSKMGASGTDNFCLRWNDFAENVSGAFKELRTESDFFDVTLACTDSGTKTLQAHKVILSACSNFFKSTFRQQTNANKHPNPYIYLRGVTYTDLTSILDFIYNGEVNVAQEDLNSFLAVAEELQIKGLTNRDTPNSAGTSNSAASNSSETPKKFSASTPSASKSSDRPRSAAREEQPPVKKVRKSSPAPIPTPSKPIQQKFIEPIEIEPEEVKEVVNIKDDPEVVMASTSAVNVDEAGQDFGGDEYDESYDGYYEDDGAEMGDGAEGTDGTKGIGADEQNILEVEAKYEEVFDDNGKSRFKCLVCGKQVNLKNNMRQHVRNMHAKQTNNVCQYCQKEFKNNLSCQRHIKNNRCPILSTIASAQIIEYQ